MNHMGFNFILNKYLMMMNIRVLFPIFSGVNFAI